MVSWWSDVLFIVVFWCIYSLIHFLVSCCSLWWWLVTWQKSIPVVSLTLSPMQLLHLTKTSTIMMVLFLWLCCGFQYEYAELGCCESRPAVCLCRAVPYDVLYLFIIWAGCKHSSIFSVSTFMSGGWHSMVMQCVVMVWLVVPNVQAEPVHLMKLHCIR